MKKIRRSFGSGKFNFSIYETQIYAELINQSL